MDGIQQSVMMVVTMNLIERFTSQTGRTIRVLGTEDNPMFCAKDICNALGIVNHRVKVGKLDQDESRVYVQPTPSGKQKMIFVTEPGLYKMILTSRGSCTQGTVAHTFTRWVTHDVLPSIRRNQKQRLLQSTQEAIDREQILQKRVCQQQTVLAAVVDIVKVGAFKRVMQLCGVRWSGRWHNRYPQSTVNYVYKVWKQVKASKLVGRPNGAIQSNWEIISGDIHQFEAAVRAIIDV